MTTKLSNTNTRSLLKAGVLVGPLFIGLSLILAFASSGFDLTKHQISLLLVGDLGWLQMVNFAAAGLLAVLCAVGLRRALKSGRAHTWGPILVGAFGLLLIVAGIFHPDPQLGFPAGAPSDVPASSAAASMHSLAFSLLALAIVIGGFVFARRYFAAAQRAWGVYSIVNSVIIVVLIALGGMLTPDGNGGLPLLGVAAAISFWVSAIALRTLRDA